jgi:alkylation response protein AidB-like acyl-CoA dehydrogenase
MGVRRSGALGRRRLDYVSLAVALEEIAAGDGAVSTIVSVQNSVVCGPINAFGTDAQKERFSCPLARRREARAVSACRSRMSAPTPAAITTRAERRGDRSS